MNVLIVDDSKPILMMFTDILEELGYKAFTAKDGEEAYRMIKEHPEIELILLDWNMPVMNGLEFLEKNKAKSIFDIPIFMMTTEKSPEKIQKTIENGVVDYIMKPFTPYIVQTKIEMFQDLMS